MLDIIRHVFAAKDGSKVAIVVFNDSYDEWIVDLWEGEHNEDARYFTDDKQDAIATAMRMVDIEL